MSNASIGTPLGRQLQYGGLQSKACVLDQSQQASSSDLSTPDPHSVLVPSNLSAGMTLPD